MLLNNYCKDYIILKIVLICRIYGRKRTIPASAKNILCTEEIEITPAKLIKKVASFVQKKLKQPYQLASANNGYIILS